MRSASDLCVCMFGKQLVSVVAELQIEQWKVEPRSIGVAPAVKGFRRREHEVLNDARCAGPLYRALDKQAADDRLNRDDEDAVRAAAAARFAPVSPGPWCERCCHDRSTGCRSEHTPRI